MKKEQTILLSFLLFLIPVINVSAQNKVRKLWMAQVDYRLSYTGFPDVPSESLPKTAMLEVRGSNTRLTKKTPQETTYLIGNRDSMMLLNMAETETDRVAVRCDSVDIISAQADIQTTIETKSELRTILGYPCHGYLVTMIENGDTYTEEIWATDYIGGKDVNFFLYPDVQGVILYSRRSMQEQTVEMKAVKVTNRTAINAGSFSVPMDFSVEPCGN
jgi:hypothetical protein